MLCIIKNKDDIVFKEIEASLSMQQIKLNYLTDGHGDVREITDKQGNTLVKYSYDAWGNPTMATIPPSLRGSEATEAISRQLIKTNPYTYASYRYDQETGLYYLRARYYDPITGRFLSKDPILKETISKEISDIGKANPLVKDIADELVNDIKQNQPYAYAKNNPVNYVDPDGEGLLKIALAAAKILLPKLKSALSKAYRTVKNIRAKIKTHGAHHYFGWPFYSKRRHVQVTVWIKGKKGSMRIVRIPY